MSVVVICASKSSFGFAVRIMPQVFHLDQHHALLFDEFFSMEPAFLIWSNSKEIRPQ